jgi:alkanesulfonate monooxygenase SsuD/methylene tetrahydromethanopterin reductase-like flavin-dependent oxidoreductase (luciferase family)
MGVGAGAGPEQFDDLGEETDQRRRGEMLDEGLAVVTGLWSGEPFEFRGKHYHLKPTTFLPKPLQQPRIPIWVAGVWPNKRPLARMACWDGMFPNLWGIDQPSKQQVELRQMVARVQEMRRELSRQEVSRPGISPALSERPFDVIMAGETPPDRPGQTEEQIAGFAAAGATWWLESLVPQRGGGQPWSLDQLRARVQAGPFGS